MTFQVVKFGCTPLQFNLVCSLILGNQTASSASIYIVMLKATSHLRLGLCTLPVAEGNQLAAYLPGTICAAA